MKLNCWVAVVELGCLALDCVAALIAWYFMNFVILAWECGFGGFGFATSRFLSWGLL